MSPRVGAVGCGHWGQNIVRDLVALGATVHVADASADGRARAGALGATTVASGADKLPPCDGYVVATPAAAHRSVVEGLLDTGVPIFLEKPPCGNLGDVRALAASAGDRVFVMHKWRYHPGVLALRDVVRDGTLGRPVRLETTRTGPEVLPPGVDVTWHLAVHDLSIALEVFGVVPTVRSAGGACTADGRITRCDARLETGDGVEHRLRVAAEDPDRSRELRVVGSDGWARLGDARDDRVEVEHAGRRVDRAISDELPLERELATFLDHLGGGPAPKSPMGEALGLCEQVARIDELVRAAQ